MPDRALPRLAPFRRWTRALSALRPVFGAREIAVSPSVRGGLLVALLFVVGAAALFLRVPLPWRDVLWTDDGGIFLEQAYAHPFFEALTTPYAGYVHLVPRVVAELTTRLPIELVPAATSAIMAVLTSLLAVAVFVLSAAHLRSLTARLLLWALMVAAPLAGMEIALSTANFQWYLLAAMLVVTFSRRPGAWGTVIATAVATTAMASSALALLFLPLLLIRAAAFRRRQDLVLVAFSLAGAVFQVAGMLATSRSTAVGDADLVRTMGDLLWNVALPGWIGPAWAQGIATAGLALVLGIVLLGATVALAIWATPWTSLPVTALIVSFVYFVGVMLLTDTATLDATAMYQIMVGSRYRFPAVFAVGIVIVGAADRMLASRRVPLRVGGTVLVAVQLLAILTSYSAFAPRPYHLAADADWRAHVASARAECAAGADVGWLRGKGMPYDWDTIVVPCAVLSPAPSG
jgi:hypothetical protein